MRPAIFALFALVALHTHALPVQDDIVFVREYDIAARDIIPSMIEDLESRGIFGAFKGLFKGKKK
jgi:hypothetical protein